MGAALEAAHPPAGATRCLPAGPVPEMGMDRSGQPGTGVRCIGCVDEIDYSGNPGTGCPPGANTLRVRKTIAPVGIKRCVLFVDLCKYGIRGE